MAWTISIEGTNEFGDICRREVRIDKSDKRLRDGDLGLSIDDGKKIMVALQSAVVNEEAEAYTLYSTGLSGLPQLSASQGLYDASNSNDVRHGGGSQSPLDVVPGLPSRDGRRGSEA